MDHMDAFDRQIASEVLSGAGPSEPVDDLAVFDAVTAANQSPKWRFWSTSMPSVSGSDVRVTGRTQIMFSPVKAIVAGALVFALGGVLFVAQPLAQQGASVPGAATEVVGPMGANYFTATDTPISDGDFDWQPGPGYTEAAGVTAATDFVASDPRISGQATWTSTARFYPYGEVGGVDPAVWASAVRIENADGAWVGTMTGYHDPEEATREWNVVTGEGAYDGLTAVFRFVSDAGYEGVIVPGGLPPIPEPSVE